MPYIEGVIEHRYWNANYRGICIVAKKGKVDDWAAYIGADDGLDEDDCIRWTIGYGVKLDEKTARAIFPDITMRYRH